MAGQEVTIRPARDDEFDRAGDVAVQAFSLLRGLLTPENWAVMENRIRDTTVRDPRGYLLVADLDGEIVGSVRYTSPGHGGHEIYPDRFAYIRAVAVSPHHLRRGIGQMLTEACIDAARCDRADAVGLHVAEANAAARALYDGLGFQFYRQAPNYFGIPYQVYYLPFPTTERQNQPSKSCNLGGT